jgi:phosphoribosylamine--glycine ligase
MKILLVGGGGREHAIAWKLRQSPRVLEFNARFGDPETQVLLPLLESDLVDILEACIDGRLRPDMVRWSERAALGVVLAAAGYPGQVRSGDPIELPVELPDDTVIFHAGTAERDNAVVTAGGRVLTVVGLGDDLRSAHRRAYALADEVRFAGRQLRRDIGHRGL